MHQAVSSVFYLFFFVQLQEAESPELLQLDELFDIMERCGCDLPVKVYTYCMLMTVHVFISAHQALVGFQLQGARFLRVGVVN